MTQRQQIAIGVDENDRVWEEHFGTAPVYHIYNQEGELVEKRANPHGGSPHELKHHGNPKLIADLLPECGVFLARRLGDSSKQELAMEIGISPVLTEETEPQAALRAYLSAAQG